MPARPKALSEALILQETIFEGTQTLRHDNNETKDKLLRTRICSSIAMLAKAWESLEDRKRILKGKPLPGSLKPEPVKRKPKRQPIVVLEAPAPSAAVQPNAQPTVVQPTAQSMLPNQSEGGKESLSPAEAPAEGGGEGIETGGPL